MFFFNVVKIWYYFDWRAAKNTEKCVLQTGLRGQEKMGGNFHHSKFVASGPLFKIRLWNNTSDFFSRSYSTFSNKATGRRRVDVTKRCSFDNRIIPKAYSMIIHAYRKFIFSCWSDRFVRVHYWRPESHCCGVLKVFLFLLPSTFDAWKLLPVFIHLWDSFL